MKSLILLVLQIFAACGLRGNLASSHTLDETSFVALDQKKYPFLTPTTDQSQGVDPTGQAERVVCVQPATRIGFQSPTPWPLVHQYRGFAFKTV